MARTEWSKWGQNARTGNGGQLWAGYDDDVSATVVELWDGNAVPELRIQKSGETFISLGGKKDWMTLGTGQDAGQIRMAYENAAPALVLSDLDDTGQIRIERGGETFISLGGKKDWMTLGTGQDAGQIRMAYENAAPAIVLSDLDDTGEIRIEKNGTAIISIGGANCNMSIGGGGQDGDIIVKDRNGADKIHLDGDAGDIKLLGADCAENFPVLAEIEASTEPGTVLVIAEGGLKPCFDAYQRSVAGVVSGAGDLQPGIRLGMTGSLDGTAPVALVGRVYCKVDAAYGAVGVGDLLTTSPTPGHAMRASEPALAFGAVLGKAMAPLAGGCGLIPILVCLQ